MAKVKQPQKEFWESDKKPDFLQLVKNKDGSEGIVKFVKPKVKKRVKKIDSKKLGVK